MQVIKTVIELEEVSWEDLGGTAFLIACLGVRLLYKT